MRDLIMEGIAEAASRTGISFRAVNGSGRELQVFDGEADRHFRCKSATRDSSGQIQMMASSDAPLSVEDDDSLYPVEAWVFSWIASGSVQLDEVFIARILKFVEGNPGHLELGSPIPLLGTSIHPGGGGFKPASEGLEGFDDDSSSADDADTA
ncbi:MAG: hypothetical protein K0U84_18730 [Actinomycetia bacterium]|nr:hypothetical protein [Actinomycetes bacterium]